MDPTSNNSSPVPITQREIVSKFPRLENGHPVASLDPKPIASRDGDINSIWRFATPHFKMYMDDIVIKFDVAIIQFNRSTPPAALNAVREGILKRLAYDGIKTGRITMTQNHQHQSLELGTPGFQMAPSVLQKEIFSLITVKREPNFSPPSEKPA